MNNRIHGSLMGLVTGSILGLQSFTSQATPGGLDTTFGGTGLVRVGFGGGYSTANAAAVQPDGKLILAGYGNALISQNYSALGGDFLIARFTTNNVLDASFGNSGVVVTKVSTNYITTASSVITAIQLQADGQIVAAGYSYQNTNYPSFTLVRYNTNGVLDTTFGTNGTGIVYTDFGQQSQIAGMVIESDSNIVVAGSIGYQAGFALAHYNSNGAPDPAFGSGGVVTTPGPNYSANAVMEADGGIVAVGTGTDAGGYPAFAVFRYTTNGVPDTTFGGTGEVFSQPAPNSIDESASANVVTLQEGVNQNFVGGTPDRIVVAGTIGTLDNTGYHSFQTVMRYNLNGSLDTSFGSGGIVTNAIIPTGNYQYCTGLNVQGAFFQPRLIIIGGYGSDGTNYYYSLARFTAAGELDTSFGANSSGKIVFPVANLQSAEAAANAMVLQEGNFVLAGQWDTGYNGPFSFLAAARFTASGQIDTTFGTNGLLLADVSDSPRTHASAVAVQPDGKIVVAGTSPPLYLPSENVSDPRFALARFNTDGSLDTSFGPLGKMTTVVSSNDAAYAVALQPDGKIIAAGSSDFGGQFQFALARFNTNGSLDASFGNNGVATAPLASPSQVNALLIQSDGKILAAGSANQQFAVARFNADGTLDTSFGAGGQITTSFEGPSLGNDYGVEIQPDKKIVAAGYTEFLVGSGVGVDIAAARYDTNGALDFSFGSLGRTTANAGGESLDAAYAMALQPDGKILLAGSAGLGNIPGPGSPNGPGSSGNAFVALARFNTNGTLDASFGSGGTVLTQVGAYSDFATSLALQSDGRFVVAGASESDFYQFFAMRYNPDGSVDDSYGNGGAAVLDFGSGANEFAYGLALDSSGRAVLAGDAGGFFGVARLLGGVVPVSLTITLTLTNTAVISWPYPSTGWNLQQNSNLTTANWVTPPDTISNNGTNNFIIVSPAAGNLFFRLSNP